MLTNSISRTRLILKTCEQSAKLSIKKPNKLLKIQAGELKSHFSKEDIQRAKGHTKRCSTSLIIREMQK